MQLVLIAHGSGAALQIGHVGIVIGHDERAFELACLCSIDAEVAREFHRASHALRNVDKRAITEHGTVECSIEIVGVGHHTAQVLAHQVRIVPHGLSNRAEYDAQLGEALAVGGAYTHAVDDGVNRHAAQCHALLQGDSEFVEGALQFGVNLSRLVGLLLWGSIVADGLVVNLWQIDMPPCWLFECLPMGKSLQSELEQPFGLMLECRDLSHDVLVKTLGNHSGLNISHEAVLVFLVCGLVEYLVRLVFLVLFVHVSQRLRNKLQR